uniref:Zn(2)-C6 fungal-type domain-containing protein n=1 Tax=Bionectria ochroleuca TaxID=29856 RepID=A0A8H7N2N3_BIOOC
MPTTNFGTSEGLNEPARKRHAKLFHRKTRTGCQRCRIRRVKCDESKPICSNCKRLDLVCEYAQVAAALGHSLERKKQSELESIESESRRKLELNLFYHYSTETGKSIAIGESTQDIWGPIMCQAALRSDAVLNSICLLSALHKTHKAKISGKKEAIDVEKCTSTYLHLALNAHHKDLSHLTADNIDYACLASSAFRVYDFHRLQNRALKPYTPPVDWLRMTGATHIVFLRARELARGNPESIGWKMTSGAFYVVEERQKLQHSEELIHLLDYREPLEDTEADETLLVYSTAISVVGAIWRFRHAQELCPEMHLRLLILPMLLDDEFVAFVEERRPRALAILVHYFVMLRWLSKMWYIG